MQKKKKTKSRRIRISKQKNKKLVVFTILFFLIIIFLLFILFLGDLLPITSFFTLSSDDVPLTEDAGRIKKRQDITSALDESGEIAKRLYESDEIVYNYKEEDYTITVTEIAYEKKQITIRILVSSVSKYYDIKENEILEVDLDVDGYEEISISIFELNHESVIIIIKKLNEKDSEVTGKAILEGLEEITGVTKFWSGAIIVIIVSLIIIIKIYRGLRGK